MSISCNNQYIVTGGCSGEIWTWDINHLVSINNIINSNYQYLSDIPILNNSNEVIVGGIDDVNINLVNIFNSQISKILIKNIKSFEQITSIIISNNNKYFVCDNRVNSYESHLSIYSLEMNKVLFHFAYNIKIQCVAITNNDKNIISINAKGTINIWDSQTGACIYSFEGYQNCYTLKIFDDNHIICVLNLEIRIINIHNGLSVKTFNNYTFPINDIAISSTQEYIISGHKNGSILVLDIFSGKITHTFRGHTSEVRKVLIINNDTEIISASNDGSVKIWSIDKSKLKYTLYGFSDGTNTIIDHIHHTISNNNYQNYLCLINVSEQIDDIDSKLDSMQSINIDNYCHIGNSTKEIIKRMLPVQNESLIEEIDVDDEVYF